MQLQEIEKEKMDVLKLLAETNLKVSDAKSALIKLKGEEEIYLQGREKEAVERIGKILADSEEVLAQVAKNYTDSADLSNQVGDLCAKVIECIDLFEDSKAKFKEKYEFLDQEITQKEEKIAHMKRDLASKAMLLDEREASLDQKEKKIVVDRKKLIDDRKEIERAITRLKEGRI